MSFSDLLPTDAPTRGESRVVSLVVKVEETIELVREKDDCGFMVMLNHFSGFRLTPRLRFEESFTGGNCKPPAF